MKSAMQLANLAHDSIISDPLTVRTDNFGKHNEASKVVARFSFMFNFNSLVWNLRIFQKRINEFECWLPTCGKHCPSKRNKEICCSPSKFNGQLMPTVRFIKLLKLWPWAWPTNSTSEQKHSAACKQPIVELNNLCFLLTTGKPKINKISVA